MDSPANRQMMDIIKQKLMTALSVIDAGVVGCQRRQQWTPPDLPWRWIRGNALLSIVCNKKTFYTFCGPQENFFYDNFLCLYRAGPWNTYWVEDFYDTWSLVRADEIPGDRELFNTIIVFHENKGELDLKAVPAPKDWQERVNRMEEDWNKDPRGRISKATSHALKVCRFCPVKVKCDAHDRLKGEDDDWSPNYPTP